MAANLMTTSQAPPKPSPSSSWPPHDSIKHKSKLKAKKNLKQGMAMIVTGLTCPKLVWNKSQWLDSVEELP